MIHFPTILLFLLVFISTNTFAASPARQYNLDFEVLEGDGFKGWSTYGGKGNYTNSVDKYIFQRGDHSASIEFTGNKPGFNYLIYNIPVKKYQGQQLTLKGHIKTKEVSEGWAGLWVRIDPKIANENMKKQQVTGTTDWQAYEITVDLEPLSATHIRVGALLVGKGKMWVDNLQLFIDGQPIQEAAVYQASMDTEFDKGSKVKSPELTDVNIRNLVLLGRVWGFLKYYHPVIASGRYNWDYELFRFLPDYLASANKQNRDEVLLNWVNKFGEVRACNDCNRPKQEVPKQAKASWMSSNAPSANLEKKLTEIATKQANLDWIHSSTLSEGLRQKLTEIANSQRAEENYYLGSKLTGQPVFQSENLYSHMSYPDAGFRLLAVYRLWNIVEYFFPYKYLIDKNWDQVLAEYVVKYLQASDELAYELATLAMIGDIQDTHAQLGGKDDKIEQYKGLYFPPVFTKIVENKLVVLDFYTADISENKHMAQLVGLEIGDVIQSIDGKDINTLIQQRQALYPASNFPAKLRDLAPELLRSNRDTAKIEVERNGVVEAKTLKLYKADELKIFSMFRRNPKAKSFKMVTSDIGYIDLKNIALKDVAAIKSSLKATRGAIVDLRNYPSAFVTTVLGEFFVSKDTDFASFTVASHKMPGEFNALGSMKLSASADEYQGKLVVLVNEVSQSQAEFTAMAFRAGNNTSIIGSTTAGADGDVSSIFLPGGLVTRISALGVYYPNGIETQRVGIVPDITIHPTIEGIRQGRDELLEAAIELILSGPESQAGSAH